MHSTKRGLSAIPDYSLGKFITPKLSFFKPIFSIDFSPPEIYHHLLVQAMLVKYDVFILVENYFFSLSIPN
jgi:hypothetical protein